MTDTTTPRALLLDFGGVLTNPIMPNLGPLEAKYGLAEGAMLQVLISAYQDDGDQSTVAQLERGELSLADFEVLLAQELGMSDEQAATARIAGSIFGDLELGGPLWSAAQILRREGVRTALLSNSWGTDDYPMDLLHTTFDELVISGEVGLRKPDPAIFELTAERVGVPLDACVFVDDHPANLEAASALGVTTVLHRGDHDEVVAQLADLFATDLSSVVPFADLATD